MTTAISTLYEEKKVEASVVPSVQQQPNRSRCKKCCKKIGLLGHECACLFVFCSTCRHAEEHNCTVNYKSKGKEKLEKSNPLISTDKLVRL